MEKLSFINGTDVSWLEMVEDCGGNYYENGQSKDCLEILKANGVNYIRLRIWNKPEFYYCGKEATLNMAKRVKENGFKFLLDFHYSDFWADPAKQYKPAEWDGLNFKQLAQVVYEYTKDIVSALNEQGTLPDMVQVGNEIINGMIWPEGKLSREYSDDEQWSRFADLVKAGISGVKDSLKDNQKVNIMIHIDRGGDNESSCWFFDNLIAKGVEFDTIGQSFYPLWHGTLKMLKNNLEDLALRYNKDLVVVEIAYPFMEHKDRGIETFANGNSQLHEGYPATPRGQENFMRDLMNIVKEVPEGRGKGIFYWEPDWIRVSDEKADRISVNNWYNQALFDLQGNALQALKVFKEF